MPNRALPKWIYWVCSLFKTRFCTILRRIEFKISTLLLIVKKTSLCRILLSLFSCLKVEFLVKWKAHSPKVGSFYIQSFLAYKSWQNCNEDRRSWVKFNGYVFQFQSLKRLQGGKIDLIIRINIPKVTSYHPYYLWKSTEMVWENLDIAIATNWINNVTFAWYTNVKGHYRNCNSYLL